jgi:hypothetical protein
MKKMAELRTFLVGCRMFHHEKIDVWAEKLSLQTRGKMEGNRVFLHRMTYRAVFSIEHYEYQKNSIDLLSARLITWLGDNDERSDMSEGDRAPEISVDVLDDYTADIEITLTFEEDVYIAEDESGGIEYAGRRWKLEKPEHDIAESFDLINQNE